MVYIPTTLVFTEWRLESVLLWRNGYANEQYADIKRAVASIKVLVELFQKLAGF